MENRPGIANLQIGAFARILGVTPPTLLFLLCAVPLSVLLSGCAAPGEPYERKAPVPMAVTDLAVKQVGNDVVLTFTLPQQTVDRRPLKELPAIEIYRGFPLPVSPPSVGANKLVAMLQGLVVTIPPGMVESYMTQGHVVYPDPILASTFSTKSVQETFYFVQTRASEKKSSAESNHASLNIYALPNPIIDLKAEVTHAAIALSWSAPQKDPNGAAPAIASYRVYRGASEPGAAEPASKTQSPLTLVGESDAASTSFNDSNFEFGKAYVYAIRSVVQYPSGTLESGDSNLAVVTPRDTFPPVAPQGLLVVLVPAQGGAAAHLELSWAISSETDIAGYNVYRGDQESTPGTRLNTELLLTPAFRDMNIQPGHRYFYSVTAVDRTGNESPLGAVVSGGVPAESQATP
ncbi:MAG: fibronectin type III domain-containing protein [Candidatus Acidiferrales bacterium]